MSKIGARNTELVPGWILDRLDETKLSPAALNVLAVAKRNASKRPLGIASTYVRLHKTERELITEAWNAPCDSIAPSHAPLTLDEYLQRLEACYGPGTVDRRRVQMWQWPGRRTRGGAAAQDKLWSAGKASGELPSERRMQKVFLDGMETPEDYLNRQAAEIERVGEVVEDATRRDYAVEPA